jgi:hypothetical protein
VDWQRERDVMFNQCEFVVSTEMSDIFWASGCKVVKSDDLIAASEKGVSNMRTDKACSASQKYAHFQRPIP